MKAFFLGRDTMELFDLYDKNFNKLPNTMERGSENDEGEYHLVVHVWIRNSKNEYLIQQRNKLTDRIPFQWACTAGAVRSGETSMEGALRETKEEIGIALEKDKLSLCRRYFVEDPKANYIVDCYLYESDILLTDCIIDTVEVRDIKYATMKTIRDMIVSNKFWDAERHKSRKGYLALLEKS